MGLLGNLFGGAKLKKASKKAAKTQVAAMQQGIGEQNKFLDLSTARYQPYIDQGTAALGQYGNLLGTGGADAQAAAIAALKASPQYQSLFDTGQETLLQNASATGGLRGGNTERGLADFGRDTLAQTIDAQLQRLGGTAQTFGMGGLGALSELGSNATNNITDLLVSQGQAKADDILRRGAISNSFWSGLGSLGLNLAGAAIGVPGLGSAFGGGGAGGGGGGLGSLGSLFGGGGGGGGFSLSSLFGGGSPFSASNAMNFSGAGSGLNFGAFAPGGFNFGTDFANVKF